MLEKILAVLGVFGVILGLFQNRSKRKLLSELRKAKSAEETTQLKTLTDKISERRIKYEKLRRDAGLDKPSK